MMDNQNQKKIRRNIIKNFLHHKELIKLSYKS
jgi:hypothetical protein